MQINFKKLQENKNLNLNLEQIKPKKLNFENNHWSVMTPESLYNKHKKTFKKHLFNEYEKTYLPLKKI